MFSTSRKLTVRILLLAVGVVVVGAGVPALESRLAEWSADGLARGQRLSEPRRIALQLVENEGLVLPPRVESMSVAPCVEGDELTDSDAGFGYLNMDRLCTAATMSSDGTLTDSRQLTCDPVRIVRRLVRPGPFQHYHSIQYMFVAHTPISEVESAILGMHRANPDSNIPFYRHPISTTSKQCTSDFGLITIESGRIL